MPSGGIPLFGKIGKKSPRSPKAPLPAIDDLPPIPNSLGLNVNIDSQSLNPGVPHSTLPTTKSEDTLSISSLKTDLSAGTLHIRETGEGLGGVGGGGALQLFADSATSSPIDTGRARSPLVNFVRSRDQSPEPREGEQYVEPSCFQLFARHPRFTLYLLVYHW